ncbi:MAG: hypothetical protein ACYTER_10290 [Planctomycetota bacterium]
MKRRKIRLLVVFLSMSVILFFSFFKIEKVRVWGSGATEITLVLNKVVKHDVIYPTELISIDQTQKTVLMKVEIPNEGWRQFKGREEETIEEVGYIIQSIDEDQAIIHVPFPYNLNQYKLSYRWK